jgi:hypothetical protein
MVFAELESHLIEIGLSIESLGPNEQSFMVIKNVRIPGGSHDGELCEVAIRRSDQNPWLPEAQIHVRPHLTPMGQNSSQASPLGTEWQYLSRRFDPPPTPRTYYAFILTALGEL